MHEKFFSILDWIDTQQECMVSLLTSWANINSGSYNLKGLNKMLDMLEIEFQSLEGNMRRIPLPDQTHLDVKGHKVATPSAEALQITKRPKAPIQVFLAGHFDTVYSLENAFQTSRKIDSTTLNGPGVADMKGGLVIMLKALQALERSPYAKNLGWEVLLTPDEEIGSPCSEYLYIEGAKHHHVGLIFEPSFADGALVSSRKGTATFILRSKGRPAHSGRDFEKGRNAIVALSKAILEAEKLTDLERGITVNIGRIEGGGASNIVPEYASTHVNVRIFSLEDLEEIAEKLNGIAQKWSKDGIELTLIEDHVTPPKPFDGKTKELFEAYKSSAELINQKIHWRPSGGASDGSRLQASGLINIDSLGPIGGNIHSSDEYILIDSLSGRAKITALFLMRLADGDIKISK